MLETVAEIPRGSSSRRGEEGDLGSAKECEYFLKGIGILKTQSRNLSVSFLPFRSLSIPAFDTPDEIAPGMK